MLRCPPSERQPVVVIGAGVAGLACALELAARGIPTVVLESSDRPGGKMARSILGPQAFDAGPTVLTMRWVFEELFAQAGESFAEHVPVQAARILARHRWPDGARLDLHADPAESAGEIGRLCGAAEARRFETFCAEARATYQALERDFIRAQRPSPVRLAAAVGSRRPADLLAIRPFDTLWRALARHFHDPRLQQLFGRYATYCGSSPFEAPATLMLVAHVEQDGVWLPAEGMFRIAEALERVAARRGAAFCYGTRAESIVVKDGRAVSVRIAGGDPIEASAVVVNADVSALARGLLGPDAARAAAGADRLPRSLSAVTWQLACRPSGFPLLRHNVFFAADYRAEFDAIFGAGRLPADPSIYLCAQDRGARPDESAGPDAERLFVLINAPPAPDSSDGSDAGLDGLDQRVFGALERFGVELAVDTSGLPMRRTTPQQFAARYPGTRGALYGSATHGWRASFARPMASTAIEGLYLAGGSVHPGPGVPMAALSGRLAAQRVLQDA
jgi:1-hydroxycarotenoid 3,4-desaturase